MFCLHMEQPYANFNQNASNFKDDENYVRKDPLTGCTGYREETDSSSSSSNVVYGGWQTTCRGITATFWTEVWIGINFSPFL